MYSSDVYAQKGIQRFHDHLFRINILFISNICFRKQLLLNLCVVWFQCLYQRNVYSQRK